LSDFSFFLIPSFAHQQPQFVLDVEVHELRINAGLQDRVIQKYNGCGW
jgi:hypothetical protein